MILRPDFLFFSGDASDSIVADIVDPHGDFLADGVSKLRGLADYAEKHEANYGRIEAVAEVDGSVLALLRNASSLLPMIKAAKGYPEGSLPDRQFEPEVSAPRTGQSFAGACLSALAKLSGEVQL